MATSFWTDGTLQDPKRQYRFQCVLPNLGDQGCSWFIKSVDRPNLSLSEASHEYLNHTFYYPGRVSWNTVSITLVDPVSPDATAIMMGAIQDSGYKIPGSASELSTVSKSSSIAGLGTVEINVLDAEGGVLEQWKLNNGWIKSVNLSGLDYGSDGLTNVTIDVRYDWATCSIHGDAGGGGPSAATKIFSI